MTQLSFIIHLHIIYISFIHYGHLFISYLFQPLISDIYFITAIYSHHTLVVNRKYSFQQSRHQANRAVRQSALTTSLSVSLQTRASKTVSQSVSQFARGSETEHVSQPPECEITHNYQYNNPSKHETLSQCWASVVNGGPTLFQCIVFAGLPSICHT